LARPDVLILPDLFAEFLEKVPQFVIGHAALFDLAAERSEGLVHRARFLDVSLDERMDVVG
jgi:hypothetical protein